MIMPAPSLPQLAINTIRFLSIDAVQKANSGHPGLPMGAAPMAYVLWQRHLKHEPRQPLWPDRDRFVLSAGHGSMLLYSLLHLTGYELSMDDLQKFRQFGSRTPGHPENFITHGVEATTGPLGQGSANAVGMAMAERWLAGRYNRPGHTIVDHFTYALVSDGDLMEGLSGEAASIAGHLGLGKLIYLYDDNLISLDGPTSMAFTEDVARRYEAYGWHVQKVADGDTDLDAIDKAIVAARAETGRPSLICVRTTIGYGSPAKAGKSAAHGSPLGPDEVKATKQNLGWDPEAQFHIPAEVLSHFREAEIKGAAAHGDWHARFAAWAKAFPELAAEWHAAHDGKLLPGWDAELPTFKAGDDSATRESGGKALNAVAKQVPWLIGGDADLGESTKTVIKDGGTFGKEGAGRNVHFGVREHAMGSIANGMAYHRGVRPFTATFFAFADYERPAMRLAALSHLPVIFVFTHDSVGLGEDGPTHQPVEHLASVRCMPGMSVWRPADANEVTEAWRAAMQRHKGPTTLVLSRQKTPTFDRGAPGMAPASHAARGAYVLAEAQGGPPQVNLMSSGTEVAIALAAQTELQKGGVRARVVSMPSWDVFEHQGQAYMDHVLPPEISARVSIEAGATFGWHRWLGSRGIAIGVDRYGASAPAPIIYERLGLTPAKVVEAARSLL
jgi:transketolase